MPAAGRRYFGCIAPFTPLQALQPVQGEVLRWGAARWLANGPWERRSYDCVFPTAHFLNDNLEFATQESGITALVPQIVPCPIIYTDVPADSNALWFFRLFHVELFSCCPRIIRGMRFARNHRWTVYEVRRGPLGGLVLHRQCARCGAFSTSQTFSRRLVPECIGAPFLDPATDRWLLQFIRINSRHRPLVPWFDQKPAHPRGWT